MDPSYNFFFFWGYCSDKSSPTSSNTTIGDISSKEIKVHYDEENGLASS
jgi:hypothetical protein